MALQPFAPAYGIESRSVSTVERSRCGDDPEVMKLALHAFELCVPRSYAGSIQRAPDASDFAIGPKAEIRVIVVAARESGHDFPVRSWINDRRRVIVVLDPKHEDAYAVVSFDASVAPESVGLVASTFALRNRLKALKFFVDCRGTSHPKSVTVVRDDATHIVAHLGDVVTRDRGVIESIGCGRVTIREDVSDTSGKRSYVRSVVKAFGMRPEKSKPEDP